MWQDTGFPQIKHFNGRPAKSKVGYSATARALTCQWKPSNSAAFVLALRGTPVTKPMLYLCDNQALLKAVKRWVGEGGKAT